MPQPLSSPSPLQLKYTIHAFSVDYVNSPDLGLRAEEFKALVKSLVDSVDLMKWIWAKGDGHETDDDQFLTHRKG